MLCARARSASPKSLIQLSVSSARIRPPVGGVGERPVMFWGGGRRGEGGVRCARLRARARACVCS